MLNQLDRHYLTPIKEQNIEYFLSKTSSIETQSTSDIPTKGKMITEMNETLDNNEKHDDY